VSDRQQGAGLTSDGPPRAVLIGAIAVAVAAVAAVLTLAAISRRPEGHRPVVLPALPAPQAGSPGCQRLMSALPQQLGDYQRATAAEPVPSGAAAWQRVGASEPVVLRCGLDRPPDFVVGAAIQVVNAVQWFQVADPGSRPVTAEGRATWFTVDRPVYIALTLPAGSGPTPIQQLSDVIAKTLPPAPIRPGAP
jgi:hypothetical protein